MILNQTSVSRLVLDVLQHCCNFFNTKHVVKASDPSFNLHQTLIYSADLEANYFKIKSLSLSLFHIIGTKHMFIFNDGLINNPSPRCHFYKKSKAPLNLLNISPECVCAPSSPSAVWSLPRCRCNPTPDIIWRRHLCYLSETRCNSPDWKKKKKKKREKKKKKKPLPGPAAPVVLPQNASNINSNTDLLWQ